MIIQQITCEDHPSAHMVTELKQSMGQSGAISPPTSTKYKMTEQQYDVDAEHFQTVRGGLATRSCSMWVLIFPFIVIQQPFKFIGGKALIKQLNVAKLPPCYLCVFIACCLPTADVVFQPKGFISFLFSLHVQFEIQKLRIYCDPEQNNRETACEIPGVVSRRVGLASNKDKSSSHLLRTLSNYICFCSETHCAISSSVNSIARTAWHKMILAFFFISTVYCSIVL